MTTADVGVEELMGVLYLTEQYSIVKRDGEALVVDIPASEQHGTARRKVRVPMIRVDHVVVFGDITLTTPAIQELMRRRVGISYLTQYGRSYGTLLSDPSKNVALREAQHAAACDHERRFTLARSFISGKLRNMRTILLRYERKREDGRAAAAAQTIRATLRELSRLTPQPPQPDDRMHGLGVLLGHEGQSSAAYFGALAELIQPPWQFSGRTRRPPRDPINALLSFGYVVLTNQIASLINVVGLDPYIGYLHRLGFGKPALALDLLEEFRPLIVDSVVITLLNTGGVSASNFDSGLGGVRMDEALRRLFLEKLEERLSSTIRHPVFGYSVSYRRCIELQVRLLGKALSGEIPAYIPFVVR